MARHTFLFEEGLWRASGFLVDAETRQCFVNGESRVRHGDDKWINSSRMAVLSDPPLEIVHEYYVTPFSAGRYDTTWSAQNSPLGRFGGTMILVADVILSRADSADHAHWTVDVIRRVSSDHYENRGAYFHDGRRVCSWIIDLRRTPPPP